MTHIGKPLHHTACYDRLVNQLLQTLPIRKKTTKTVGTKSLNMHI